MNAKNITILRAHGLKLPVAPVLDRQEEFALTSRIRRHFRDGAAAAAKAMAGGKTPSRTMESRQLKRFEENPRTMLAAFASREALDDFDLMIASNTRLVLTIANGCAASEREAGDLVQAGLIGLMIAIGKFDPARGYRFSTYGNWWIRAFAACALRDAKTGIRVSPKVGSLIARLKEELAKNAKLRGAEADAVEAASRLGIGVRRLEELRQIMQLQTLISLDAAVGEGGDTLADAAPDRSEAGSPPDDRLARNFDAATVRWAIDQLDDEREKRILELHYGLRGGREHTFAEIGKIWGLSRQRIQQIEEKANRKLRRILIAGKLAPR